MTACSLHTLFTTTTTTTTEPFTEKVPGSCQIEPVKQSQACRFVDPSLWRRNKQRGGEDAGGDAGEGEGSLGETENVCQERREAGERDKASVCV